MGLNDLSVVFLLLLSRSLHLAADTPASARVGDMNSTCIKFQWTESPSQRLKHILLKATSDTGSTVEAKIAPNIGQGYLKDLEPYTDYSTSVTYVTADDSAENVVHDTGTLRTLPGAADTPASARVGDMNSTSIEFLWTESPSQRLQHILLKATSNTGSTVEAKIAPNIGQGYLEDLEPYTYYSTSVTYVTADDSAENVVHDTGTLRTWPGVPSPPTITSIVSTGAKSIRMSWLAPAKPNGEMSDYWVICYPPGDILPVVNQKVSVQSTSTELKNLSPDHPYECRVSATTNGFVWGRGGGMSSSPRSSIVRTWPGTTEQPTFKYAIVLGERMMLLEWTKPKNIEGVLGHYAVNVAPYDDPDSAKNFRTKADSLKLLITHLQANTKYKFTIRAYVLPDEQGHGGGYSIPSVAGYVTTSVSEASSAQKYNWETGAAESDPAVRL